MSDLPIPIGNRVLVVKLDNDLSRGGLSLPSGSSADKHRRGKVLAVGSPRILESGERIPLSVSVGQTVMYGMHAGVPVRFQGEEYWVIPEGELLAVDPRS